MIVVDAVSGFARRVDCIDAFQSSSQSPSLTVPTPLPDDRDALVQFKPEGSKFDARAMPPLLTRWLHSPSLQTFVETVQPHTPTANVNVKSLHPLPLCEKL